MPKIDLSQTCRQLLDFQSQTSHSEQVSTPRCNTGPGLHESGGDRGKNRAGGKTAAGRRFMQAKDGTAYRKA